MIKIVHGDATNPIGSGPKIIVHCCNDIGVWGAGFVLALSKRWPGPEEHYRAWARLGLKLGEAQIVPVQDDIWVANIVGQSGVGSKNGPPVRYDAIHAGLGHVASFALKKGASVHMPKIGCGLAGGKWSKIEPIIEDALCRHGIEVFVYEWK